MTHALGRALGIGALTLAHLVLSIGAFFFAFGVSMSRMDSGTVAGIPERIVSTLAGVLLFPLFAPASRLLPPAWRPGGALSYALLALNSLIWALGIYFLWRWVRSRRSRPSSIG